MKATFGVLTASVLLSLSTCAISWAQAKIPPSPTTPPSQNAASAAPARAGQTTALPAAIPAAGLAFEAERANSRLRQIRMDLDAAVKLSDVDKQQLEVLTASLQRIRPALEGGGTLEPEELFNFRQDLARLTLRLKELQNSLVPQSRALEERREELIGMELLWKVTFQSMSGQEAPGSSRDLVLSTRQQIEETMKEMRTARPALLTIQDRVSEQCIAGDLLLARINDAIAESRTRLFTNDREPLWRAFQPGPDRVSVAESFRNFYFRRTRPLVEYVKENRWRVWLHLLISSFLVWLLKELSRGNREWLKQTDEDRKSGEILRHPLAAALVVSLLLSFSVYPNAPMTLYQLPLLLMVLPLARVVSPVLSRDERATFCLLAGLYVLWRMDALFFSADLLFRLFVLVMTGLALFCALWGARLDRTASRAGCGPWRRTRLQLLRLAAVLLLGSLIASVLGNVTLASLITGACISSAYLGAAIFAGVLTLEGFILPLLQSPLAQRSLAIRQQGAQFRRRSSLLIRFAALTGWLWSSLVIFGVFGLILEWLSSVLSRQWALGRMAFSLGGILLFVVTIVVSVRAARFASFVCEKDVLSRLKLPRGIPATVSMLVRDCVIALGVILALAGAGVQWSQIVLIASAIGVGIGFGLQQLVASFIAGLILIFERPIRVGDYVEVGVPSIGRVVGVLSRIGLRSSTIVIEDGSDLICPNNRLIGEHLLNWTLSNQLKRVELEVGVARASDPDTVLRVLKRAAYDHPEVISKPEPTAMFKGFGESSLIFLLRFFAPYRTWMRLNSEVGVRVHKELRDAGIEIALPQCDIRIADAQVAIPTVTRTSLSGDQ